MPSAPEDFTLSAMSVTSVLLCWNHPPASDTNCPPTNYVITITIVDLPSDHPEVIYASDHVTNMTVHNLTQDLESTLSPWLEWMQEVEWKRRAYPQEKFFLTVS